MELKEVQGFSVGFVTLWKDSTKLERNDDVFSQKEENLELIRVQTGFLGLKILRNTVHSNCVSFSSEIDKATTPKKLVEGDDVSGKAEDDGFFFHLYVIVSSVYATECSVLGHVWLVEFTFEVIWLFYLGEIECRKVVISLGRADKKFLETTWADKRVEEPSCWLCNFGTSTLRI